MFFWIELGLGVLTIAIGYAFPSFGSRWFERVELLFSRLARRRILAVVTVGLTALAARAALLPILPIPQPGVQDEFGYLLLADTFAHGRLTNPTHPMWVHFESFHILWQPTYTAKFYPAQGLIMALGQVLMGHPFWGVWLSVGLMCAAICWMLQAWLPPGWALAGGFLAVIRLGTFSYWANGYWGGALTATGGALVLGALPRIKRSQRWCDVLLMGLGLGIIALSRPYEGLFFGLPVAGALVAWMLGKSRPPLWVTAKRVLAPLLLLLVLTGCGMGYYFWRTTGSPFHPTYLVYERSHNPAPYFPWQSLGPPPVYHHAVMRDFYYDNLVRHYLESRSAKGIVDSDLVGLVRFWDFYLGPGVLPSLPAGLGNLALWFFVERPEREHSLSVRRLCGGHHRIATAPLLFAALRRCYDLRNTGLGVAGHAPHCIPGRARPPRRPVRGSSHPSALSCPAAAACWREAVTPAALVACRGVKLVRPRAHKPGARQDIGSPSTLPGRPTRDCSLRTPT